MICFLTRFGFMRFGSSKAFNHEFCEIVKSVGRTPHLWGSVKIDDPRLHCSVWSTLMGKWQEKRHFPLCRSHISFVHSESTLLFTVLFFQSILHPMSWVPYKRPPQKDYDMSGQTPLTCCHQDLVFPVSTLSYIIRSPDQLPKKPPTEVKRYPHQLPSLVAIKILSSLSQPSQISWRVLTNCPTCCRHADCLLATHIKPGHLSSSVPFPKPIEEQDLLWSQTPNTRIFLTVSEKVGWRFVQ